jgi:WD40 repeat protein
MPATTRVKRFGSPRAYRAVGRVAAVLLCCIIACPCRAEALKERLTFPEQDVGVWSTTLSPDGKTLVMGLQDGTIKLWDASTTKVKSVLVSHNHGVVALAFSPDGKTLASGSRDKTLKLWNVSTGRNVATWVPRAEDAGRPLDLSDQSQFNDVACVAFSPDGKTLASGSMDKAIRLWDIPTGRKVATLRGHADEVHSLAFGPDGKLLASAGGDVKLWDVAKRTAKATFRGPLVLLSPDESVMINKAGRSVAFSPDGRTLAVGGGRALGLWDVSSGRYAFSFSGFKGLVEAVSFSPDGRSLAAGGPTEEVEEGRELSEVRLLSVPSGECVGTLRQQTNFHCVVFSPDGNALTTGTPLSVKVWQVGTRIPR